MTQFGDELGKGKVAASLYLTLPGVPFIYYGEEIGMIGDAPDEQGRRPMQWNTESYAGFSTIEPWKPIDENYSSVNVASETNNPDSLLSHYRTLIFLRNHHPALRGNDMIIIPSENPSVFASIRFSNQELMFILINLAGTPITGYNLSLSMSELSQGNYTPVTLLGVESTIPLQIMGNGGFLGYVPFPEIPAYSTTIIQLIQK
jgi:glycosidase